MKVKFKVGQGNAVVEYNGEYKNLGQVIELLNDDNVISISVVKQTPAQYFKEKRRAGNGRIY